MSARRPFSILFPYTTLFRSVPLLVGAGAGHEGVGEEIAIRAAVQIAVRIRGTLVGRRDKPATRVFRQHGGSPQSVVGLRADAKHQRPGYGRRAGGADSGQLDDYAVIVGGEKGHRIL